MRFGFDATETEIKSGGSRQSLTPPPSSQSPKSEVQWVPLQNHPLFSSKEDTAGDSRMPMNLMAWDGASRLYLWDSNKKCLHRISIRLGEPDPDSILAASPSKVLLADAPVTFNVNKISVNRNGSALLLAGLEGLCVMYLYGRSSLEENTIICRSVSIGCEIYFNKNNYIRTLQISWHPCSDTHIGILSSDSVFRIFDLSSALEQPEQEYYLQPIEPGSSCKASSICPVDFSFGGDHLWDRFSVFILFSDGSIYILCPVVPYGSVHKLESILEIYNDVQTFGMKSSNSRAINNSNLAITWLEATFPELAPQGGGGNLFAIKAHPFVLFDASVSLQGPLRNVYHSTEEDSEVQRGVCEGRAVSFLYNLVSKDSILVTAWTGGQLRIDALADEIQPVWEVGSVPRVRVDMHDRILGAAMICESVPTDFSLLKFDEPQNHTAWLGHPPPVLRLAIVDLALPKENDLLVSMIADPVIGERIYCLHDGGIDSIVLHFLPFTSQTSGKEEPMKTPSVRAVLSTCSGKSSSPSRLHGFLALCDSFGSSWVVGLAASRECIVLQMETWNLLLTHNTEKGQSAVHSDELKEIETPTIISKELLAGPKAVMFPLSAPNLHSATADSIEGRATLHQYFKLFHENYVEYAHKVYFELQHHAPHLKKIIDNQHSRLREAQHKLLEVEKKQEKLESRLEQALQRHTSLEEHLHNLKSLPGLHKKPLSKAEQDFKSELDRFTGVELDALHSSIEALDARLRRHLYSSQTNQLRQKPRRIPGRAQDDEVSQLKSARSRLSLLNSENTEKVKLVESALKNRGISD